MESSKAKQRDGFVVGRPWWRWNLITLTVALFVLLWVREIGQIPLSMTWTIVATVFGVWYLVPSLFAGVMPWPLSILGEVGHRDQNRTPSSSATMAVVLCRLAAVVLVIGATVQFAWQMYWVLTQWQSFRTMRTPFPGGRGNFAWTVLAIVWPPLQSLAIAIGLWTIADLSNALRSLTDLFAYERRKDVMQRDERSSSGPEALRDGTDSMPQGSLKPDNRQGR